MAESLKKQRHKMASRTRENVKIYPMTTITTFTPAAVDLSPLSSSKAAGVSADRSVSSLKSPRIGK